MKKRLLVIVMAAVMMLALPATAFAANSPSGNTKSFSTANGTVIADFSGISNNENGNAVKELLVVTSTSGTPGLIAAAGSDAIFFNATVNSTALGKITGNFGTLVLSFPVTGANGTTYTVWHEHSDGSITSESVTARNGYVTISVTSLSDFAVKATGGTGSTGSTTSPKTGADAGNGMALIAVAGVAVVAAAGTVAFMKRKTSK